MRGRSTYVIFYREGEEMKRKLMKVCEIFSGSCHEIPDNIEEKQKETADKITELDNLISLTKHEILRNFGQSFNPIKGTNVSNIEFQWAFAIKEKTLLKTMNYLKLDGTLLFGICWCPASELEDINEKFKELKKGRKRMTINFKKVAEHDIEPPTYLKTNEFLWAFQEVVSTYGTPRYREVNPAFFTIITFPFIFGVMFGDALHGSVLLILALYLIIRKNSLIKSKSMIAPLIVGRYFMLIMGIFSIFSGFIYNEVGGLNINFPASCFKAEIVEFDKKKDVMVNQIPDCVYPFGLDPYWKYSNSQLKFENSFKMKLSVILGVIHMLIGLFMKLVNSIAFKKTMDIFFEVIPQMVFLLALFGSLNAFIIVKWLTDYTNKVDKAPYITTLLLDMFLSFGNSTQSLFDNQIIVLRILVIIIIACIPIMLIIKPLLLRFQHKKENQSNLPVQPQRINESEQSSESKEPEISQIMGRSYFYFNL